jgi:two-component system, OmpR family, sensor histidine kinase BaeS
VVWAASRRAGPEPGDVLWLRISLGLLCALTLVVVVSALHRMQLYQEAYGFTQARLVVDVFEGWLGVVVLAVALSGVVRWGAWVPRFALITGVVGLLGIAAVNPDELIARHNIERYEETGKIDVPFLSTLSDDAVPVLASLPEPLRTQALGGREPADDDWLAWNLGRWRAADYLVVE